MHVQLHSKTASLIIAQNIMLIPVISVSATPASSFICVKDVSFSKIISSNVFLSELKCVLWKKICSEMTEEVTQSGTKLFNTFCLCFFHSKKQKRFLLINLISNINIYTITY